MPTGRLMPQVSYADDLSPEEIEILAGLSDEQKLAMAHGIRIAVQAFRRKAVETASILLKQVIEQGCPWCDGTVQHERSCELLIAVSGGTDADA